MTGNEQATAPATGAASRPERLAGLAGLVVVGILALICVDLLTGGRLTSWIPATAPAPAEGGCVDC